MNSYVDVQKVYIILGKACNFKCRYCIQKCNPPVHLTKSPSSQLIDFLQMLAERQPRQQGIMGELKVNFFGGEPLLYFDAIKEVVARVDRPNLKWSIVTNGSLLTEEIVAFCNEHDIRVLLSYDGKWTEATRGIDVLRNPKIVELYKKVRRASIETVLTPYNQDPYELIDTMEKVFGRKMRFKMMFLTADEGMPADLLDYDLEAWKRTCKRMADAALEQFKFVGEPKKQHWESAFYWGYINPFYNYVEGQHVTAQCGINGNNLYLDLDANVWFCDNAIGKLGTVSDDLDAIISASDSIHDALLAAQKKDKCPDCQWFAFCRGKCPLEPASEQARKQCEFQKIFFASVWDVMKRFEAYKLGTSESQIQSGKRVVVFHRPKQLPSGRSAQATANKAIPYGKMGDFEYALDVSEDKLRLTYKVSWLNRRVEQQVELALVPWSYQAISYRPTLQRTDVRDEEHSYDNRNAALRHVFADQNGSIGRVVVTDKEVFIFLRGRINDIAGVENVLLEENENSIAAFCRCSENVKQYFARMQARKDFIANTDWHEHQGSIGAQLDALTQVVLDSGIADDHPLRAALQAALPEDGQQLSAPDLLRKMDQKKKIQIHLLSSANRE